MKTGRLAANWRVWGLATFCGALLTGSFLAPSIAHSQDQPTGGGVPTESAPVSFAEWYNPIDPTDDFGPLRVCYSSEQPPSSDFIERLMEQLHQSGSTPESYHLVHPDGVAMNNRFQLPGRIGPDGMEPQVAFSWWEHDGIDDGSGDPPIGRYFIGTRWSGAQGSPRALTWSLVKEGTNVPGAIGEAASASNLFANLDADYAAQGGRATWILRIQQAFDRWAAVTSLTYTRVSQPPNGDGNNDDDDGAAFSSSGGAAGLRGDIRVAMHNIDGANGVLAYTFFPSNGDMVFDSSEGWGSSGNSNRFFRNTFEHEHGHGIGIDHVCSSNAAFLMEPFLDTSFDGVRHDDIRAGQRHYGDLQETDDTTATAADLGTIALGSTNNTFCNIPAPVTGTSPTNSSRCSIDANGEQDYFRFTVTSSGAANITVTPLGFSYQNNAQNADGSCPTGSTTNSLQAANLAVELIGTNGTTVLASASGGAIGVAETISSATLSAAGTYYVRVFESDAPTVVQMYSLSVGVVATGCIAPAITTHPTGDTICVGDPTAFTVTATGTAPLNYQWRKNTVNIGGATNPTLNIAAAVAGDAGSYDCVVANACGSATSNAATLVVQSAPTINTHPSSQTVSPGANASFSVGATGDGTLLYQWRRNGVALSDGGQIFGSTTANLLITNVTGANAGNYTVDVQNGCGAVTSNTAVLTVCAGASIVTPPSNQTVCEGAPATFTVVAGGSGPINYQWRKNTVDIGGATNSSYTIPAVVAGDAGNYDCVVSNACGNATSSAASLTVNTPVSINSQPGSLSVSAGATVNFSVGATGSTPLSYQWKKNGSNLSDGGNISGATTATLTVSNVTTGDNGSYSCDVTNSCGTVASDSATLTVTGGGCLGDFNNDGVRDLVDLTTLLANFGTAVGATPEMGDMDLDGDIDLGDLTSFLALFGVAC